MWGIFGAIVGAIVGVAVAVAAAVSIVVVAPAAVGGAIIGIVACAVNAFGICPPSSSSNGGSSSGAPTTITPAQNPTNNNSNGSGSNNNGSGGTAATACSTTGVNACGMHGTGFITNGVCSATVPANSSCPLPVISGSSGFYANPTLIKSGEQTTLYWNVSNATECALSGGGLSLLGLPLSSNHLSGSVTQKTTYTLNCKNGIGGPSSSANATVNLVPAFQEI